MGRDFVKIKSLSELMVGDTVKHARKGIVGGEPMVVTANHGDYATAVVTAHVSEPDEWLVLRCGGNR